ncbi:MAG: hypothetical protein Gaeavirus1_27 [Gaeavirus sp.]|uniref:Disease resistance R13L4/SHOC-2-like LRR domain-containing protein n=1 Tax=Gaeavirus sp. TaxID=2487767 RepID=A0A3G4ZYF6_9VIRU|nr:MAG: hypothetical protein Gaeavirus1_27 [Gaeavirus sp.]
MELTSLKAVSDIQKKDYDKITTVKIINECSPNIFRKICKFTNLRTLNITTESKLNITHHISNLTSLTHLEIQAMTCTNFANNITKLSTLEKITLHTYTKQIFPPSIANLQNLNYMHINGCDITLPDEFAELQKLRHYESPNSIDHPNIYTHDNKMLIMCFTSIIIINPDVTHLNILYNAGGNLDTLPMSLQHLTIANLSTPLLNLPTSLKTLNLCWEDNFTDEIPEHDIKLPYGCTYTKTVA